MRSISASKPVSGGRRQMQRGLKPVLVWLKPLRHKQLKRLAANYGMSMAEYCRRRILEAMDVADLGQDGAALAAQAEGRLFSFAEGGRSDPAAGGSDRDNIDDAKPVRQPAGGFRRRPPGSGAARPPARPKISKLVGQVDQSKGPPAASKRKPAKSKSTSDPKRAPGSKGGKK